MRISQSNYDYICWSSSDLNYSPNVFDYLINNIRPRKRWSKWLKPDKIDNLELVKIYFGFGNEKAKEALEVLTSENIEVIKSKLAKGGMEKSNERTHRRDG